MFTVASSGSLVLFIVPRFTQATFAKPRAMENTEPAASVASMDATALIGLVGDYCVMRSAD